MKKFLSILMIIVTVIGMLSGCSSTTETSESAKSEDEVVTVELDESAYVTADGDVLAADLEALVQDAITKNYPDESETATTEIDLSKESDVVNIRNGGTYVLTGEFDGQIFVDTDDEDVQLILAGVTLTNDDDAPIYIMSADEATITLKSGTTNTIVNTSVYMEDDGTDVERANGAIYSKADLAINGDGSLEIVANNKTAILGKDDVVILSGHIKVSSERNGIKGKDLLYIGDVDLEIESGKAGLNSEVVVYIDGSEININDSYEGIESYDIMIKDGLVNIVASDDGINIANPDESSSMGGGFGMPGSNGQTSTHGLRIYGGSVNINSNGDGLDSNASIWMTGGLVTVSGPTSNGNGSLDYDQTFTLDGGILIAVGSLGMVQTPSDTSSQNILAVGFETTYGNGSLVEVVDDAGDVLIAYTGVKDFQSFIVSSNQLVIGETYQVVVDGDVVQEVTLNDLITKVGNISASGGGGGGGRGAGMHSGTKPTDGLGVRPEDGGTAVTLDGTDRPEPPANGDFAPPVDGAFTPPEDGTDRPEPPASGDFTPPTDGGFAPPEGDMESEQAN